MCIYHDNMFYALKMVHVVSVPVGIIRTWYVFYLQVQYRGKRILCRAHTNLVPCPTSTFTNQLCGAGASSTRPRVAISAASPGARGRDKNIPVVATAPSSGTSASDLFEAERGAMKVTILKEAVKLANQGLLGALETRVLKKMVSQESPVLMAAYRVRMNKIPETTRLTLTLTSIQDRGGLLLGISEEHLVISTLEGEDDGRH